MQPNRVIRESTNKTRILHYPTIIPWIINTNLIRLRTLEPPQTTAHWPIELDAQARAIGGDATFWVMEICDAVLILGAGGHASAAARCAGCGGSGGG